MFEYIMRHRGLFARRGAANTPPWRRGTSTSSAPRIARANEPARSPAHLSKSLRPRGRPAAGNPNYILTNVLPRVKLFFFFFDPSQSNVSGVARDTALRAAGPAKRVAASNTAAQAETAAPLSEAVR